MSDFNQILKRFLHDPIDKSFNIRTHEKRAREYAHILGVSGIEEAKASDQIASCMERSLLPKEDIFQDLTEIRHPLSEGFIGKSKIPSENFNFDKVKRIFEEIRNEIEYQDENKKFLYLWRNLEDVISKDIYSEWKKFLSLLPADTRMPDHSIWEHLKITSAINAFENLQNNSLFLFTIGPVQAFISQARKTQDLYMGSFLLSYLTFIGMTALIDKFGPTCIIYPDLFRQPFMDWYLEKQQGIKIEKSFSDFITIPTIPNRFVAIIPETDEKKVKDIAEDVSKRVKGEWGKIKESVIDFLEAKGVKFPEDFLKKFHSQVSEFPEIYWTAIPWRIDERDLKIEDMKEILEEKEIEQWNNIWEFAKEHGKYEPNIGLLYGLIYTTLEKSIGARKNLRNFKQFLVEEKGRKCSLCGERDVLVFNEKGNKKKFTRFKTPFLDLTNDISNGKIPTKYLSDGEGLCGICFIKRTLELYLEKEVSKVFKDISFPSTAEIACADFKEKVLKNNTAKKLYNEYIDEFKKITHTAFPETDPLPKLKSEMKRENIRNLEGEWFFLENLTEKVITKNIGMESITEKNLNALQEKLNELIKHIGKPTPYYAVIMLDGDNMGKWLSGENLPDVQYAYNQEVWKKLKEKSFAGAVKKVVSQKVITPAIHASISSALRNYSLEFVRKIVEEEHLGKLVYAGGDDVLAFVNLKDLLPVMSKLRAAFSGQIKFDNGEIKVDWENENGFVEKDGRYYLTMGKNATASMGVVIAHYKMPLKIVLDKAREMEKLAKNELGKDSFAIGFFKHSGEAKITGYKWRYKDSDEYIDTVKYMTELKKHFTKKESEPWLSKSFVYNLDKAFMKIKEKDSRFSLGPGVFESELKRLIKRAINGGNKEQREQIVKEVFKSIDKIFWKSGANIDYLVNLLEICAFLSGEEESK